MCSDYQNLFLEKCEEHLEKERGAGHEINPARPASQQDGCASLPDVFGKRLAESLRLKLNVLLARL